MTHVVGGHLQRCGENAWIVGVQTVEQGGLSGARDKHAGDVGIAQRVEHPCSALYLTHLAQSREIFGFLCIYRLAFIIADVVAVAFALFHKSDYRRSGHTFIQENSLSA